MFALKGAERSKEAPARVLAFMYPGLRLTEPSHSVRARSRTAPIWHTIVSARGS